MCVIKTWFTDLLAFSTSSFSFLISNAAINSVDFIRFSSRLICACKSSSPLSSQVFFDLDLGLLLAAEEAEEPRLVSAKLVFLPLVPFPLCALLGVSSVVLVVSPALYLLTFIRTLLLSVVSVLAITSVCDEDWLLPVTVKSTSSEAGGFLCYLNGHNINTKYNQNHNQASYQSFPWFRFSWRRLQQSDTVPLKLCHP